LGTGLKRRGAASVRSAVAASPLVAFVLACPAQRYQRPPLPAPRYEVAPVAPWDAGGSEPGVLDPEPGLSATPDGGRSTTELGSNVLREHANPREAQEGLSEK
jgi:hypothetical protein